MVSNIKFSHTGGSHIRSKTVFKNTTKDKVENFRSTHSAWHHSKNMRVSQNIGSEINKENKIASWIVNTLNPINHIPVIGTIKKLHSKAADSLDLVQSMIGGMIYGGPFGMIKGIGSWIAGKFINNNKVANKPTEVSKNSKQPINSFKAYINNKETPLINNTQPYTLEKSIVKDNSPNENFKKDLKNNTPSYLKQSRYKVLESYSDNKRNLSSGIKVSA